MDSTRNGCVKVVAIKKSFGITGAVKTEKNALIEGMKIACFPEESRLYILVRRNVSPNVIYTYDSASFCDSFEFAGPEDMTGGRPNSFSWSRVIGPWNPRLSSGYK